MKKIRNTRSRTVLFRVTEAEYRELVKRSGHWSISQYARSVILDLGEAGQERLLDALKELVGRFDRGEVA